MSLIDYAKTERQREAIKVWATYRQALRDIPNQEGFPTDVAWPAKPE